MSKPLAEQEGNAYFSHVIRREQGEGQMRGTRIDRTRENNSFLKVLRRTANVTLAAEEAGQTRKTFQKRRARDPDFAARWDAALAYGQAQLASGGDGTSPRGEATLTRGGEYSVRGSRGRSLQVRRAPKGQLTTEGERRFLVHLAATANVRLSAEATGIGCNAVYTRRQRSAAFAREMDAALREGYERLELALLDDAIRALAPDGEALDDWRAQVDLTEPLARMTPREALLLLGYRRPAIVEGRPHDGFPVHRIGYAEAEAWLNKQLDAYDRRRQREAKRGKTTRGQSR